MILYAKEKGISYTSSTSSSCFFVSLFRYCIWVFFFGSSFFQFGILKTLAIKAKANHFNLCKLLEHVAIEYHFLRFPLRNYSAILFLLLFDTVNHTRYAVQHSKFWKWKWKRARDFFFAQPKYPTDWISIYVTFVQLHTHTHTQFSFSFDRFGFFFASRNRARCDAYYISLLKMFKWYFWQSPSDRPA